MIVNRRQVFGSYDVAAVVRNGKFVFVLFTQGGKAEFGRRFAGQLMAFDFVLDAHQAFQQRFGARRAAGDIDIDRDDQIDAFDDVITPFEVWTATGDDPATGNPRLVPAIYLSYWKIEEGKTPGDGVLLGYTYTSYDNTFEANWEVVTGTESGTITHAEHETVKA